MRSAYLQRSAHSILKLSGTAFLLAVTTACNTADEEPLAHEHEILAGTGSSRPEVVLLTNEAADVLRCSGVLIRPDVVLTARHCADFAVLHWAYVGYSKRADVGTPAAANDEGGAWQRRKIAAMRGIPLPNDARYTCPTTSFPDVALLRLESPFVDATVAEFAEELPRVDDECLVVGYGDHFSSDGNTVNEQRAAKMRITVPKYESFSIRAQGIDGTHASGDSGGPLLCGDRIVGITSCTLDTGATSLGNAKVYANVTLPLAQDFIAETLESWSRPLPPPPRVPQCTGTIASDLAAILAYGDGGHWSSIPYITQVDNCETDCPADGATCCFKTGTVPFCADPEIHKTSGPWTDYL